ncbi:MAG: hypothetical protein J3K34DRAFT_518535 [Monoraphidium minutum]|nr:MAG: hypothetical protein J3K34DRAFT_518535 [Monoraphidium minutum]
MHATVGQRAAAEELRKEGNALFQRAKFSAAAERYTEAITLDPSNPALFVNRALCLKKQGAPGAWQRVAADAASALALDARNLKASYLTGVALRELGGDLGAAIAHLGRALEWAREKDDAIKDEIWRELARANDAAWRAESAARHGEADALQRQLRALARAARAASPTPGAGGAAVGGGGDAEAGCVDWGALDRLFERAAAADERGEVPSAFTCPLTMEVFRDPVTSRSGHTYERAALTEHLTKVGGWDPITRAPTSLDDVRPNIAMRGAVALYLQEHGWAWHECC